MIIDRRRSLLKEKDCPVVLKEKDCPVVLKEKSLITIVYIRDIIGFERSGLYYLSARQGLHK